MTLALWGAGLLAFAAAAHFTGKTHRLAGIAAWLGIVLICQAGVLASGAGRIITAAVGRLGGVTSVSLGLGVAAVLVVAVVFLGWVVGVHLKDGAKPHTVWLALGLGLAMILAAQVVPGFPNLTGA